MRRLRFSFPSLTIQTDPGGMEIAEAARSFLRSCSASIMCLQCNSSNFPFPLVRIVYERRDFRQTRVYFCITPFRNVKESGLLYNKSVPAASQARSTGWELLGALHSPCSHRTTALHTPQRAAPGASGAHLTARRAARGSFYHGDSSGSAARLGGRLPGTGFRGAEGGGAEGRGAVPAVPAEAAPLRGGSQALPRGCADSSGC